MSVETEIAEGRAAQALLADSGFQRATQLARQKIIERWAEAKTVEERESLWHDWHAVGRLVDQLNVVEGRGHLAQAALKAAASPAKPTA